MISSTENQVLSIVQEVYGLSGVVKPLVAHADVNYRLQTPEGSSYVIKISPDLESGEQIKYQTQILELLKDEYAEGPFPTTLRTLHGDLYVKTQIDGKAIFIRILSWLDGILLKEAQRSTELYFAIGKLLGRMDRILFYSKDISVQSSHYEWDLQHALISKPLSFHIGDTSLKRIVDYFFQQFEIFFLPQVYALRKGIIHSDANDYNILVSGDKVTGLIDFGDTAFSPIINELAIALTYSLMDIDDPVAWAGAITEGYHNEFALEEKEIDILYYLVGARLAVSLSQSSYLKTLNPDNEYLVISEKPAIDLIQKWIRINPISFTNSLKRVCGFDSKEVSESQSLVSKRAEHVNPSLSTSYTSPIKMEKACFQYMYADDGNTYLDCVNNICHVGHNHPKVVEAARKQMGTLNTNTRYLYNQLNDYTAKLASRFPDPLNVVYLTNSGSEAGDLAQRIVRTVTGSNHMVVVDHAYHGNTIAGIEVSPYKYEGKGGTGKVGRISKLTIPDGFRGQYKYNDPGAGEKYALEMDSFINALVEKGESIAGFICESIIGCGGQVILPDGYLENIYQKVRNAGGLCIADEVQVGFGRVGEKFWGFELQNVVPDLVVIGKPMGNGHPIAGVVTTHEIANVFNNGMEFFSSFGGNPVSCAIGEAVLDVIEEEGLQAHAYETGTYFRGLLNDLAEEHHVIGDVRGYGLFLGVELILDKNLNPATKMAREVIEKMKKQQILLSTDGPYNNVLKIKPPMCFNRSNADQVSENLNKILSSIS